MYSSVSPLVARAGERIHSSNQEDKVIVKTAGRNDIAFSSSRFDAGRRRTRALPKQYKRLCSCGEIAAYHLHRREVSSCSLALRAVSTGHWATLVQANEKHTTKPVPGALGCCRSFRGRYVSGEQIVVKTFAEVLWKMGFDFW